MGEYRDELNQNDFCNEGDYANPLQLAISTIRDYCESHPTCDGCDFRKEHIGCEFRGKSPREW